MHGHWLKNILGGGSGGDSGGGGSAEPLIIHEDENGVLDKTWKEIHDALAAGVNAVIHRADTTDEGSSITETVDVVVTLGKTEDSDPANITYAVRGGFTVFETNTETGFPYDSDRGGSE